MTGKKIALVLDDTLDTPDGVQQYVLTLGRWLGARGHEVHYIVGETKRTDIENLHSISRNVHVRFNGNRLSVPLPTGRRRIKQVLRRHNFDVVHVQVPYSPFMAGRLLKLVPDSTAVVGTFHVLPYGPVEKIANTLLAHVNKRTGKRFDAMIAASQPAADFARACYGFAAQVIPHPFSYAQFAVAPPKQAGPNIVYMARLVERKGALWFLKAVVELQRRGALPAEAKIIIGGRGPLLAKLQTFAAANGLEERVQFSGFVPEADKASFLAQADIAVFPSTSGESFGISLIEALAAVRGVVLAGDNPGYRSVMPNSEQLFNPSNTAAFADLLAYWLEHASDRPAVAQQQRSYARQFDLDTVCEQVLAVYDHALRIRAKT